MRASLPIILTKAVNIVMSVCMGVFGIIVIAVPSITPNATDLTIGIMLILLGVFKLAGYFSKDLFRLAFQYDLQLGIALAIFGTSVLVKTANEISFACAAFGAAILTDGLFQISTAFDSKKFGVKQWTAILASAIAACIAGTMLIAFPPRYGQTLKILLGVSLILEGILHLIVILSTVKIINHQMPDRLDG